MGILYRVFRNEYKVCYGLQKVELKLCCLKTITMRKNWNLGFRYKYLHTLGKVITGVRRTRVHNNCYISGRRHSIYTMVGLSRLQIREDGGGGRMLGLRKSSW